MKRFPIVALSCLSLAAFADQTDPIAPLDSLALFEIEAGCRIELVAAEPLVKDPVAIAFDPAGRMYVVENTGYPTRSESDPPLGAIALLDDSNGDGTYDSRSEFADGFDFPNGIKCWRDGILVTNAPSIFYLRDTDNDGKADVREELLTGFALGGSTQLRVSHPTLAVDNWIYLTNGLSGGDVRVSGAADEAAVALGRLDLRYNPLTKELQPIAGQAQFGLTFNDRGHRFICSNRKHIEHTVLHPDDLARNPHAALTQTTADIPDHGGAAEIYAISEATTTAFAHAGTFTAACGICVYRGDALAAEYYGNSFTCDPTGNLVHRDVLEPAGGSYVARRAADGVEFLATSDNWSRPVFLANGPDGALYVCDMYRKTIEHPAYLPDEVIEVTDFDAGKGLGRIYRVVGSEALSAKKAAHDTFGDAGPEAYPSLLAHPNAWQRETAHRLLLESEEGDSVQRLQEVFAASPSAHARLHAMYVLDAKGSLSSELLTSALKDRAPEVVENAVRIARGRLADEPAFAEPLAALAENDDSQVRFATALAIGDAAGAIGIGPLFAILQQDVDDEWTRAAVLSGIAGASGPFAEVMFHNGETLSDWDHEGLAAFCEPFGRTLAMESSADALGAAMSQALAVSTDDTFASWQLAFVTGIADGARRAPAVAGDGAPLTRLAALPGSGLADDVERLINYCVAVAQSNDYALKERVGAITLLGYADRGAAIPALEPLLTPATPEEAQVAAVQALSLQSDDRVGAILASPDRWPGYTSPVRTAAMSALRGSPSRVMHLLHAIETGTIAPWTVTPGDRAYLQRHKDAAVKELAARVFADVKKEDRSAVFQELKPVLALSPETAKGHEVFLRVCSTCHLYNGEGHPVGPDLTGLRSQPIESILLHIIDPNWLMEPGYESYVVETDQLETFTGLIVNQNESTITIRGAMAQENTIPRESVVSMTTANLSLMPDELEKSMSPQELRDLLGFLKEGLTTP